MHLLDFEHFELVRELLRNRFTIVWCTRLQRAQADDERQRIEASLCMPLYAALTVSRVHSCNLSGHNGQTLSLEHLAAVELQVVSGGLHMSRLLSIA